MKIVTTQAQIDALARPLVLVPTMGALHDGHAALIRQGADLARARGWDGGCAVTVFVNPTQFNEPADFQRYPRTLDADTRVCSSAGAACVIAPDVAAVYPQGPSPWNGPLPEVATRPGLEDAHRPGHFAGVCQVVARLFEMTRPVAAVFGEKDWQQLQVVRQLVHRLGLGIEIVAGKTVREPDGLAMSSRNRFLSPQDRLRAAAIPRALAAALRESSPSEAERAMREVLTLEGISPDYAAVRPAETLVDDGPSRGSRSYRAIIAARVGSVRLLDNTGWPG